MKKRRGTLTIVGISLFIGLLGLAGVGPAPRHAAADTTPTPTTGESGIQVCKKGQTTAFDPNDPTKVVPCISDNCGTGSSTTTGCAVGANGNAPVDSIPDNATKSSDKTGVSIIDNYLLPIINFLAGAVGLIVTISIVVGGIQYASAGDNPQKVEAAKSRITNAVLGLLGFLFLYSFLQWITPGGFFNT